jgi:hypothetical protein
MSNMAERLIRGRNYQEWKIGDTSMIWHTRHSTKTNKTQKHNTTTENYKDEQHGPHQKPGVNPCAREG